MDLLHNALQNHILGGIFKATFLLFVALWVGCYHQFHKHPQATTTTTWLEGATRNSDN